MNFRYFFGFTKGQYKGLVVLLAINFFVIGYYFTDDFLYQSKPAHNFSELIAHLDSIESHKGVVSNDSLYNFNPNTVTAEELNAFGLDERTAERVIKYKAKGGQFLYPRDLLKIYGMDSVWFNKIEPFILIENKKESSHKKQNELHPFMFNPNEVSLKELLRMGLNERTAQSWMKYLESGGSFKNCNELEKLYLLDSHDLASLLPYCKLKVEDETILIVDLNLSDSLAILKVKGVGPTFAHRIIEYRNSLGGFVYKNQLKEIYGIDSLRYSQIEPQITIDTYSIKKVQINADEFKMLLRHPYLSYEQVKSIVNYRNELGGLNDLQELQQLEGFNAEDTTRLKPYISFQKK